jgi:hypothetical protein
MWEYPTIRFQFAKYSERHGQNYQRKTLDRARLDDLWVGLLSALPRRASDDYDSRNAWPTVASIRHSVMGLMGDAMKPRER